MSQMLTVYDSSKNLALSLCIEEGLGINFIYEKLHDILVWGVKMLLKQTGKG